MRGVKCSESFWQPVQRTTQEAHVIGMVEIGCQGGRRGKDFEILSQDFATAAVWKRDSKPLFVRATRRIPPPTRRGRRRACPQR